MRPGALLALVIAGCARTPTAVPLQQQFELVITQQVRIDTTGATLRFEAVPEDSRCPVDVVCVWAGNAQVRLLLQSAGQEHPVTLNTTTEPRRATVAGLEIQLHELAPSPRAGTPTPREQYRAKLEIRRNPG